MGSEDASTANDASRAEDAGGRDAATVGATGGTVTSSDGRATLVVPPGALATEVPIAIVPATGVPPGTVGTAYDIEPTGTAFAIPATLVLAYDDAALGGVDPATLVVGTIAAGAWQPISGANSAAGHQVAALLQHLSPYGIIGHPRTPPCSCDPACFTSACNRVGGTASFVDPPTYCTCTGTPNESLFDFTWGQDDAYTACHGVTLVGGACTACIKACVRASGGWITLADDQVCEASFPDSLLTGGYQSAERCLQSCSAGDPRLCDYQGDAGSGGDGGGPPPDSGIAMDAGPTCNASTCPNGCCSQGVCVSPGTGATACGVGGAACADCTAADAGMGCLTTQVCGACGGFVFGGGKSGGEACCAGSVCGSYQGETLVCGDASSVTPGFCCIPPGGTAYANDCCSGSVSTAGTCN